MILRYHVFTDHADDWFTIFTEAFGVYQSLGSCNRRLYLEIYPSEEGYLNDEMVYEDCLLSEGSFPR